MTLEYTLTLDDLRESLALPRARQDVVWTQIVAYVVLFAVAIPLAAGTMGEESPATLAAAAAGPARDLWVTLAPSLVGVTLVMGGLLVGRLRAIVKQTSAAGRTLRPSIPVRVPVLLAFAWMILPNVPSLAIPWHPTLRRVLWAAVTPWFAYLIFACVTELTRARRTAAAMWNTQRSLARPGKLELTDDGIVATDVNVEQRFRWAHIVSYRETAKLLLLVTEDGTMLNLPKRAIADPATEGHLRNLIVKYVPRGAFLPRDAAWPVPVVAIPSEPE